MTGYFGPFLCGWTYFDTDIIDVYEYPHHVEGSIFYLKSNHELYLKTDAPWHIQNLDQTPFHCIQSHIMVQR